QVGTRMRNDILDREARVLADDEELDDLARLLAGYAERSRLEHARLAPRAVLDLVRVDLEPRNDDDVLLSVLDDHEARGIHAADAARLEPAVTEQPRCRVLGPLPVTRHDLRPARADLAHLVGPEPLPLLAENADLGGRKGDTDR